MSTLSSLLVGSGSGVVLPMPAAFVTVVGWFGAVTTMVIVVLDPAAQVARSQVTVMLPKLLQVQPPLLGVAETNVTPGGRVSVTLTLVASDAPALATSRS